MSVYIFRSCTVDTYAFIASMVARSAFQQGALYFQQTEELTPDDWQFSFWSALSLELLARAALACISPALLADTSNNWRNLLHALGREPTQKKFNPSSINAKDVFIRLNELVPAFNAEILGFCAEQADRRNAELHSGDLAFSMPTDCQWLPRFYIACKVLLESMGNTLSDFVRDEHTAQALISSFEDASAKAVQQDIKAHRKVWQNQEEHERASSSLAAKAWAARQTGHRVTCPACGSSALLFGSPSGKVTTSINGERIVQRQTMLPDTFSCRACNLRIDGLSKLAACDLGGQFTSTSEYSPAEYFHLYTEDDLEDARAEMIPDEDFND